MITSKELENELARCFGTEQYWRLPMPKLIYTDGVKLFVEKAGCYWMLNDIGLFLKDRPELKNQYFLTITLWVKEDKRADLIFDDGNGNVLYKRHYKFTDCPVGKWQFFYSSDVLMLPGEY